MGIALAFYRLTVKDQPIKVMTDIMARHEFSYEEMTGSEMSNRYCGEFRRVNRKLFERIRYLDPHEMHREQHFVCTLANNRVVGDLALEQSPREPDVVWLKHVSVDLDYRHMGIGTKLVDMSVGKVVLLGKMLSVSSYSEEGLAFLRPVIERMVESHPGAIIRPKEERPNTTSVLGP